nr:pro-cathepsin H-like [Labrus bergylta]
MNTSASALHLSGQDEFHFKSWMEQHSKQYSMKEYNMRLQIFTENKRLIEKHNAGNHSFSMGLNQFSDMTLTEFQKPFCGLRHRTALLPRGTTAEATDRIRTPSTGERKETM